jgi:hypothetical protein
VLVAAAAVDGRPAAPRSPVPRRPSRAQLLEILLVLASPVVLFFVLRLRAMAPVDMPDPAMHTAYIVFPHDFFARFSSELASESGAREGARVGFLAPARLSYLIFGAVPGFFVFRYVLAIVAVVPSYMLLRRLYGRAAGAVAIVIVMSSPVLVTAWGSDYPDSAVASYLTAGLACLAMPCQEKRRSAWLALAAAAFSLAVWSNVAAAPLVAATMVAYFAVCVWHARGRLLRDAGVLAGTAALVTALLMLASGILLGPFDYILPTIRAYRYLDSPAIVSEYHSTNRRWILLRPYLLVPVGVVGAWAATVGRRLRVVPTPQLLIGASCIAQIAVFGYLQFFGDAETLEQHYYSSSLWAAVCLVLAVTVAVLAKPLLDHRRGRFAPAVFVLVLPLVYEVDPHLPAFGWLPAGVLIAAVMVAAAALGRLVISRRVAGAARAGASAALVVVVGCALILTAAPYQHHAPLAGTIVDPVPAYATALGGSDGNLVDQYRVAAELPGFVGNSTYPDERLLMWWPADQLNALMEVTGIYHHEFNSLTSSPPWLTVADRQLLHARRPAEILVLNFPDLPPVIRALRPYDPSVLRARVLESGDFVLHATLISLGVYMRPSRT